VRGGGDKLRGAPASGTPQFGVASPPWSAVLSRLHLSVRRRRGSSPPSATRRRDRARLSWCRPSRTSSFPRR